MALQTEIYSKQALGVAGQVTSVDYNVTSGLVIDNNVCVGCFIQSGDNNKEVKGASGVAITGQILGVVVNDIYLDSCNSQAINTIPLGKNVNILNSGSILIETESQCKVGQYVFLKDDNGALVFDDTKEKASHTYTGFRVSIGNDKAEEGLIEITTALAYL